MHGVIWLADGKAASAELGTANGAEMKLRWRSHLEDLCFDALRSAKGSFEFQPEDPGAVPAGPRVELESILEVGRHRIKQWEEVESVIHSFEAVPRLADRLGAESVTLTQDKWRVLACIDGRRNISTLARRLDMEVLDFCQLLKPLIEEGAVELDQPEGWLKSLPKVRLEPDLPSVPGPERPSVSGPVVVPTVLPEGEEGVSVIDSSPAADPAAPDAPDAGPARESGWDAQPRRRRIRGRPKKPAEPANS